MKIRLSIKLSAAIGSLLAAIVTFASDARAGFDANFESFVRSFPLSGYADVQLGYDQLIWGSNSGSVMYGYVRPFGEVDTAGSYNSGMLALDYYPISFLGVRGGKEWIQNDTRFRDYRCDLYQCEGTRYREFYQANLLAGYNIWFFSGMTRWDRWTQKHPELGDAVDSNTGLAAQGLGDTQLTVRGFTGIEVTPEWSAMVGFQYAQMTRHFGVSRLGMGGPRWRSGEVSIFGGASYFESTESDGGWGAFLGLTWEPYPSLAIH